MSEFVPVADTASSDLLLSIMLRTQAAALEIDPDTFEPIGDRAARLAAAQTEENVVDEIESNENQSSSVYESRVNPSVDEIHALGYLADRQLVSIGASESL